MTKNVRFPLALLGGVKIRKLRNSAYTSHGTYYHWSIMPNAGHSVSFCLTFGENKCKKYFLLILT